MNKIPKSGPTERQQREIVARRLLGLLDDAVSLLTSHPIDGLGEEIERLHNKVMIVARPRLVAAS